MRNIYFVQAGNLFGVNAYFPYAAGCIAAYAWENPVIRDNCRLGHFTFLRKPLVQAVDAFEEPYLVAFSNYVWNWEYHKALARAVKERWPGCLVLFGGHQVLNDSSRQLDELPYVDFLIHKAGEIPFAQLLLALLQGNALDKVPSLSYRDAHGNALRTKDLAPREGCDFPSPYLTGLFDHLFEEYPDLLFSTTIETNRGCPYTCAYCDWGATKSALQLAPMERVKAEIDWAARHRIEFVVSADGNFGILERDEEVADFLVESNRRTGYPKKFNVSYAKNSNETVFRINRKLNAQGLSNGATLAFQSLSPVALENIGRKNLKFERFQELVALYNKAGVPMYSDLILGLPGETLESFARGVGTLLAAGMHGSLEAFPCEVLPNATLADPAYQKKHGVKTIRVRQFYKFGSPENEDEIPEYAEIVCGTDTMPAKDWEAALLLSVFVQGLHALGLLPCVAIFLHWERQLPYEEFYLGLMDYARANPASLMGELYSLFEERCHDFSQGKGESLIYYHPRFGEVTWPLGPAMFLCAAFESERLFRELPDFLRQYGLDAEAAAQLIGFQRAMVYLPEPLPARQTFAYDFPAYFAAAYAGKRPDLQKKRATVVFPHQAPVSSWVDFAREYVWFGRKKLTRKRYDVEYG